MSEEYRATDQLTRLVIAAKIGRLYWIDDQFGRNTARMARLISTKIATLWSLPGHNKLRHSQLEGISVGSDPEYVENSTRTILEATGVDDGLAEEMANSVDAQIAEIDPEHTPEIRDLSTRQFQEIRTAFTDAGAEVHALSYKDWLARQEAICGDLKADDLFFVDHDFSSEEGGNTTTGETILNTLLADAQHLFTCILFTHGTSIDEQKSARGAIAERLKEGTAKHGFTIVSKESITRSEGNAGYAVLSLAFKAAFLNDWCHSLSERSLRIFNEAFTETADVLQSLGVGDLSVAFFRKPFNDGTSEFDVLLRIFMLSARVKLEDRRHAETFIWERLGAIRRVLAVPPEDTVRSPINSTLQEWHEREIFDPPQIVNSLFSPVFLGDVFEVQKTSQSAYYLLVGQPCDLAIRDTGFRKSSEALFLPVTADRPRNEAFGYEFDFPKLGERWIHYSDAFSVNLNLLDLVSFREDGKMTFSPDLEKSEVMLPGVLKKFEQLSKAFQNLYTPNGERNKSELPAKYQRLALTGLPSLLTTVKDKRIAFPIARVGRIRSPHAEAILGGLAIHRTRVAFDYNFADLSGYCETEPGEAAD
jgi:hypothetical protein